MTMYKRIVVGTDGSKPALDAVRAAGQLAALCGLTEVDVVAAFPTIPPYEMAKMRAELPTEFHDVLSPDMDAQVRLNEADSALSTAIAMVPHERSGDAADAILDVAETVNADLIVVGARGAGAIGRFLRGSVSTKVAHHSPCDVLIVEHHS